MKLIKVDFKNKKVIKEIKINSLEYNNLVFNFKLNFNINKIKNYNFKNNIKIINNKKAA